MATSLTEVYEQISERDAVYLEKAAEEKLAADEADAAGRIMARGFADELNKLAAGPYDQIAGQVAGKLKGKIGASDIGAPAPEPPALAGNTDFGSARPTNTGAGVSMAPKKPAAGPAVGAVPKSTTTSGGTTRGPGGAPMTPGGSLK